MIASALKAGDKKRRTSLESIHEEHDAGSDDDCHLLQDDEPLTQLVNVTDQTRQRIDSNLLERQPSKRKGWGGFGEALKKMKERGEQISQTNNSTSNTSSNGVMNKSSHGSTSTTPTTGSSSYHEDEEDMDEEKPVTQRHSIHHLGGIGKALAMWGNNHHQHHNRAAKNENNENDANMGAIDETQDVDKEVENGDEAKKPFWKALQGKLLNKDEVNENEQEDDDESKSSHSSDEVKGWNPAKEEEEQTGNPLQRWFQRGAGDEKTKTGSDEVSRGSGGKERRKSADGKKRRSSTEQSMRFSDLMDEDEDEDSSSLNHPYKPQKPDRGKNAGLLGKFMEKQQNQLEENPVPLDEQSGDMSMRSSQTGSDPRQFRMDASWCSNMNQSLDPREAETKERRPWRRQSELRRGSALGAMTAAAAAAAQLQMSDGSGHSTRRKQTNLLGVFDEDHSDEESDEETLYTVPDNLRQVGFDDVWKDGAASVATLETKDTNPHMQPKTSFAVVAAAAHAAHKAREHTAEHHRLEAQKEEEKRRSQQIQEEDEEEEEDDDDEDDRHESPEESSEDKKRKKKKKSSKEKQRRGSGRSKAGSVLSEISFSDSKKKSKKKKKYDEDESFVESTASRHRKKSSKKDADSDTRSSSGHRVLEDEDRKKKKKSSKKKKDESDEDSVETPPERKSSSKKKKKHDYEEDDTVEEDESHKKKKKKKKRKDKSSVSAATFDVDDEEEEEHRNDILDQTERHSNTKLAWLEQQSRASTLTSMFDKNMNLDGTSPSGTDPKVSLATKNSKVLIKMNSTLPPANTPSIASTRETSASSLESGDHYSSGASSKFSNANDLSSSSRHQRKRIFSLRKNTHAQLDDDEEANAALVKSDDDMDDNRSGLGRLNLRLASEKRDNSVRDLRQVDDSRAPSSKVEDPGLFRIRKGSGRRSGKKHDNDEDFISLMTDHSKSSSRSGRGSSPRRKKGARSNSVPRRRVSHMNKAEDPVRPKTPDVSSMMLGASTARRSSKKDRRGVTDLSKGGTFHSVDESPQSSKKKKHSKRRDDGERRSPISKHSVASEASKQKRKAKRRKST